MESDKVELSNQLKGYGKNCMRGRCERMICCGYLETSTPICDKVA